MVVMERTFHLDEDFYDKSAGVFMPSEHYLDLSEHSA